MTIEQIIPDLLTGGEVVLPDPGPVFPQHWYVPATELGGNGSPAPVITDRAGAANFASVAGAAPPPLVDTGDSRYATIHGAAANRLENGVTRDTPFSVTVLARVPAGATVWRFGRYILMRASDSAWEMRDNGTSRAVRAASTGSGFALITAVLGGVGDHLLFVNDAPVVVGGALDGAGAMSVGMLGNSGASSTLTYDLAELLVFGARIRSAQVAQTHQAVRARHPFLLGA